MIYLASPYSHPESSVRIRRYRAAREAVIQTQRKYEHLIYSPISYFHPIALRLGGNTDALSYKAINEDAILASSALWLLTLDGWRESVGVQMEVAFCIWLHKPIKFLDPTTYELSEWVA